mmetsp:Transcript_9708/g.28479  ORF Transcript_9708/g.28479 Transcript_9708/m.28479 type:complete len:518 (+) Transcript_9708:583-2136(+)
MASFTTVWRSRTTSVASSTLNSVISHMLPRMVLDARSCGGGADESADARSKAAWPSLRVATAGASALSESLLLPLPSSRSDSTGGRAARRFGGRVLTLRLMPRVTVPGPPRWLSWGRRFHVCFTDCCFARTGRPPERARTSLACEGLPPASVWRVVRLAWKDAERSKDRRTPLLASTHSGDSARSWLSSATPLRSEGEDFSGASGKLFVDLPAAEPSSVMSSTSTSTTSLKSLAKDRLLMGLVFSSSGRLDWLFFWRGVLLSLEESSTLPMPPKRCMRAHSLFGRSAARCARSGSSRASPLSSSLLTLMELPRLFTLCSRRRRRCDGFAAAAPALLSRSTLPREDIDDTDICDFRRVAAISSAASGSVSGLLKPNPEDLRPWVLEPGDSSSLAVLASSMLLFDTSGTTSSGTMSPSSSAMSSRLLRRAPALLRRCCRARSCVVLMSSASEVGRRRCCCCCSSSRSCFVSSSSSRVDILRRLCSAARWLRSRRVLSLLPPGRPPTDSYFARRASSVAA